MKQLFSIYQQTCKIMTRVFVISDIHVDYKENLEWIERISETKYQNDVLLLAGDVTDKLPLLAATLKSLRRKFQDVFFVPGNHELWIRDKQTNQTSVDKFHEIIKICHDVGVHTDAKKITIKTKDDRSKTLSGRTRLETHNNLYLETPGISSLETQTGDFLETSAGGTHLETPNNLYLETPGNLSLETQTGDFLETPDLWIVPLFSWYATPDDDSHSTLWIESPLEDVNKTKTLWMDNHMCVWPEELAFSPSKYFSDLCNERVKMYDAPVISFSHFLPRQDLIKADEEDVERVGLEREHLGLSKEMPARQGAMAGFNFTRYAGCSILESQVRQMQSKVHVFGHQHRNRDRMVEGVRYVSHCLGYKREVQQGLMYGLREGPKQVWP